MTERRAEDGVRVLAVVSRFKWSHIDYLAALGGRVELRAAWSGTGHEGAVEHALKSGLDARPTGRVEDGEGAVREALKSVLDWAQPDLIHVMYYYHERLTLLLSELAPDTPIVWECRDPLTTLKLSTPGSDEWQLEAAAIAAADGHIVVSEALRRYLAESHAVPLNQALIVPHAFAARNAGPLQPKLSEQDGRTHIALVGTADESPGHGRYYVDIIRRLVDMGFVVHSHFHDLDGVSLEPYRLLDEELSDYHHHPTVSFRNTHLLSDITSRYDLMGVFHELGAPHHNESATLAVCVPTKAVSGWLHGAVPVVTFGHYGGLVELIREFGIGFVVDDWSAVGRLVEDWPAIDQATQACVRRRDYFTHEFQAQRVAAYYERVIRGEGSV